jgi:C_GCAxxG_C_C family probable redox protein
MEPKSERAAELFNAGCNCGQAVLASFCESYGITPETAMLLACGLGSGFRSGELCGAAAASAMIIGLKRGNRSLDELDKKKECYALIKAFMTRFKEINGAFACRDILKRNAGLGQKCDVVVRKTAELLENEGY